MRETWRDHAGAPHTQDDAIRCPALVRGHPVASPTFESCEHQYFRLACHSTSRVPANNRHKSDSSVTPHWTLRLWSRKFLMHLCASRLSLEKSTARVALLCFVGLRPSAWAISRQHLSQESIHKSATRELMSRARRTMSSVNLSRHAPAGLRDLLA